MVTQVDKKTILIWQLLNLDLNIEKLLNSNDLVLSDFKSH